MGHGIARDFRVAVFQQPLDHGFFAGLYQRRAHHGADRFAHRNGELVLQSAVVNDSDQILVAQNAAFEQEREGDFTFVVRQCDDQIVGGVSAVGQLDSQMFSDADLHVLDELAQDVGHNCLFGICQGAGGPKKQIADDIRQLGAAAHGLVACQAHQRLDIEFALVVDHHMHAIFPAGGNKLLHSGTF